MKLTRPRLRPAAQRPRASFRVHSFHLRHPTVALCYATDMWPFRSGAKGPRAERERLDGDPNGCRRCGRVIEVNPELSVSALEGMHWLCFHLEFEHNVDPDVPCSDVWSCPWRIVQHYEEKLRELEVDPDSVRKDAINAYVDATREVSAAGPRVEAARLAAATRSIVYVDVDDTLIRSAGGKRMPVPNVVRHVRTLFEAGAELYCWSAGGARYAEEAAREVGLHDCFRAFLPKPHVLIDDQAPNEWRGLEHRHPLNCYDRDSP